VATLPSFRLHDDGISLAILHPSIIHKAFVRRRPSTQEYAKLTHAPSDEARDLDFQERIGNVASSESRGWIMDKRSAWLRKLDEECPYQVVLPRRQLMDDSAILDFLLAHVGWFDMYVEDDHAAYVRYCFEKPLDAEIFRARFDPKRAIQARGMSV
jgi:hypothetical protein